MLRGCLTLVAAGFAWMLPAPAFAASLPTPVITSITVSGAYYDVRWNNAGVTPPRGFDVIVDGVNDYKKYRTTDTRSLVGPLDTAVEHCFIIKARYSGEATRSQAVCVPPGSGGSNDGGGGSGAGEQTPVITSATGRGSYFDLAWTNGGTVPEGGYDMVINGKDTNTADRTTRTNTTVGPLDENVRNCFAVEARYTSTGSFLVSAEVCVDPPSPDGSGGGDDGSTPTPVITSASARGEYFDLAWENSGVVPTGGFDISINGVDTNTANRTTRLNTSVGPLDSSREQCFRVEARYTDSGVFRNSEKVCVAPGGAGGNRAPSISGQPASSVLVGGSYSFRPTISDPDGDTLTASIRNKPSWASFSKSTGRLSGTPGAGDVRIWNGIEITVSDGQATDTLGPFSVTVSDSGDRSVTLGWTPPTMREDGSSLKNLAGYLIYVGQTKSNLSRKIDVSNPGVTSYVVDGLTVGTWHMGIKAYDQDGLESEMSTVVSVNVN